MEKVKIVILETSDLHGNILPIDYATNKQVDFGLARIAAMIKNEKNYNKNVLVIDNGDIIQGTPVMYYHARIENTPEDPIVKVMNYIGYDAAVVGNHDFNYGLQILNKAISESSFPWLSANTINKELNSPCFGKPYIIREFSGIKVGVLGLTTQYIPNWENPKNIEGLEFKNPLETGKEMVKYLKEKEKVDLVVVSYHGGFERDADSGNPTENLTGENQAYEICMEIPEIDVLLTGHQHRIISGKNVNGVLVLQPGCNGILLGKAVVTLEYKDGRWRVAEKYSEVLYSKEFEADKGVIELVRDYENKTQRWLDKPIGKIEGDMLIKDPMEIRMKDNAFIEFINRVQMYYANVDISNTALFSNRVTGFPMDVTMRDIVSNYIYPNTLKVLRVKGKDIKEALEKSAAYFETYNGKEIKISMGPVGERVKPYNYDMWEGIDYIINISKPEGKRIVKLDYMGMPVEPEKEYDVVMNNYRAGGGGEYFMFQGKEVIREINIDMAELIANYILKYKTIRASTNSNWRVIYED